MRGAEVDGARLGAEVRGADVRLGDEVRGEDVRLGDEVRGDDERLGEDDRLEEELDRDELDREDEVPRLEVDPRPLSRATEPSSKPSDFRSWSSPESAARANPPTPSRGLRASSASRGRTCDMTVSMRDRSVGRRSGSSYSNFVAIAGHG